MKKLLLIIFGALLIGGAQAQVLFQESFSSGTIPVPGWTIFGNASNFSAPASSNAGGTAPELQFDNDPVFPTTNLRIISPQINTTGATSIIIRFKHKFEHNSGSTAVNLSVETRGSSSGSWNNVWTTPATTSIPAEGKIIVVSNANVGSATFQLSFLLNGSSQTMKNWYIDDVEVIKPTTLDGAISSVSLPAVFIGPQTIQGQYCNLGTTPINSIDVSWRVDEGDIHTTNMTGLNIPLGGSGNYTSPDQMDLPEGDYALNIWVSNVNGQPVDDIPANDTLTKALSIPDHIVYYKPLFEEFTSSTCSPCASFNNGTFNPWLAQHTDDDLTLIKYQMNWPGSGDPYYTPEGGTRRDYYGVNAVPELVIDGNKLGQPSSAQINNAYNATSGAICNYGIESTHEIQGNIVSIDANIIPYASYSNVKVQIGIVERITTQNVATNGETEFHHVMMDMVPDGNGTTVNLVAGQPINLKFNVDMSSTNVEEMDDLMVAIFLQESAKDVLQTAYSTEIGATLSSSIPNNAIDVPVDQPIVINYSQAVRMIGGAAITNANVGSLINFRLGDATGTPVGFTATINSAKTQITITPNPNLGYLQRYYLNILPVENNNSVPTLNTEIVFTTILNVGTENLPLTEFSLYPNPVNSTLYISKADNIKTVEIYNIVGNLIKKIELNNNTGQYGINVSNLSQGLYILKAKGLNNEKAVRFIVTK
ncbi:MAG: T9SS type A sorting domain-containing protein [Chloroflexota bacterium]